MDSITENDTIASIVSSADIDVAGEQKDIDKLSFATRNILREQIRLYGWQVGAHTYGTPNVIESTYGALTIGSFCSIASNVTIILANHRIDTVSSYPFRSLSGLWPGSERVGPDHEDRGGVCIGSDVWIGYGAIILPGAKIGHGCVIGAGAVVGGSIPDYAIVAGNPARVKRLRFSKKIVKRLLEVQWWNWDEEKLSKYMPILASGEAAAFLSAAT